MGGKSNPVSDVLKTVKKTVDDVGFETMKVLGGDVNLDPFNKQKEEAKDAARADARQRAEAAAAQEQLAKDQLRQKAANADAEAGSSIILGSKRKKKKGSSVSSGMGLSKGDTGLQV